MVRAWNSSDFGAELVIPELNPGHPLTPMHDLAAIHRDHLQASPSRFVADPRRSDLESGPNIPDSQERGGTKSEAIRRCLSVQKRLLVKHSFHPIECAP